MRAFQKLRPLMDRSQQLPRVTNIQRNGDWDEGDAVSQLARAVIAAQTDRNHYAEHPPLNRIAMQFHIAPDGRRHQSENDVIHAGPAAALYGFNFYQWNLCPGEFLRSAAENVEPQPLGRSADFRE